MRVLISNIGKDIYPDLTDEAEKALQELNKRFDISINFLFSDGISIEFDDSRFDVVFGEYADIVFKAKSTNHIILEFREKFDDLEFRSVVDDKIYSIPKYNLL